MCAYHPFLFPWHGRGRAPSAQAFGTRTDRQKALRLFMVAQRGVRPQLDWPQKQSGSSVKWMVYGVRLCCTMVLACVRYEYIHAGSTVRHNVLAVVIHYAFFVRLAVVRSLWRRVS